ncbi:tape measure protein [Oceanobacillus jeddahense]|uniref:tape measure protein n=1 Tax=Oceanobacillus jeddahense TaxID=1462527 RepID=UPI0006938B1C|nr:tape measure protein [Oceanobacillus jeddahense]
MESYSVEAYLKATGVDQFGAAFNNAASSVDQIDDSSKNADLSISSLLKTIGGIAATVGVFRVLRNAVDLAFQRIDTMEQFERVMTEMTGSTDEANAVLNKTNDIVVGTAYGLDIAAASVQDFVTRGASIEDATRYIEAWGDAVAFYGNGSNEQFANVTNALQNMLTKGTVGMDQLNRLFEAGIPAVDIYAQATGRSIEDVSNALTNGEISAEDFVNTVTTAMMEGTNGVTNISGAAKEAGESWSGAFANMGAAAARGVTAIIEAIDRMLSNNGLPTMREMVGNFGSFMESTMSTAAAVIEPVGNALFWLLEPLKPLLGLMKPLIPVIGATVAAFAGMMIVKSLGTAMVAFGATLMGIPVIQAAVTAATAATSLAMATFGGTAAATGTALIGFRSAVLGLRAAMLALMGPVGWIITLGAGVVAGAIAIWNVFDTTSEETERLKDETEALGESTDSLVDSMNESAGAYKDRVNDIKATHSANNELLGTVEELSDKENKSAEDKRNISMAVEQLNENVDGLNASYNEEADMLSESTEKMQARIDLMAEQDKGNAAQERLTEILKEQQDVELQLEETAALRKEWNKQLDQGGKDAREARKGIEELDEQEQNLMATLDTLEIQYETTHKQYVESSQNARDIITDNNQDIIISYEDLEGKAQEAFDSLADKYGELKDAATDAFTQIEDETEHTMDSMIETMQHNQDMVEQWGENQGRLMEWAGQNGYESFIPFIEDMGIDQAAVLQEMVNDLDETNGTSGEKLETLAETYQEGGELSSNALKDALGEGFDEVIDLMTTLVERMETILRTQINEADWEQYGIVPPTEFAEGFDAGIPYLESQAEMVADTGYTGLSLALGNYDFETLGEKPPIDISTGMGTGSPYVEMASRGLGRTPGEEISTEIEGTPFEEYGRSTGTRTSTGIVESSGSARGAAGNLTSGVESEFETNLTSSRYIQYGSNVGQGTGTGIDGSKETATSAASSLTSNVDSEVSSGMDQSRYEGYGRNVGQGLAGGILSMMDTVSSAVRSVTSGASLAATGSLGIQSPSTVFFGYGQFVSQGLGNGILDGQLGVVSAITAMTAAMINRTSTGMQNLNNITRSGVSNMGVNMNRLPGLAQTAMSGFQGRLSAGASISQGIMSRLSSGMVSPFRGLRGSLAGVGSSAMSGLQGGLNGGVGRVMSTARSIASRVASTMRSALKINSPSHVMRDDVGRWIPEGIAVGIEQYAGKVYSIMDAMADYVSSPFDVATPQFDIAGQVANTNAQINSRINHEMSQQGDYHRQPIEINIYDNKEAVRAYVNEENAVDAVIRRF